MSITKISKVNIKQEEKKYQELTGLDVSSVPKFRSWIKEKLENFYKDQEKDIPKEHLLLFFDYINNKIIESKDIPTESKKSWLKQIRKMQKTLEITERENEKL